MAVSLHDISVKSYLQILNASSAFLAKGKAYCEAENIDLNDVVETSLRDDMLPFRFQVFCLGHHSLGAIEGCKSGTFSPPPPSDGMDYDALASVVSNAAEALAAMSADEINALDGGDMVFSIGGNSIPFKNEDFIQSFSLPNFYFHATTAYDLLRQLGVPLGKRDFLGQMRVNM